MGLSVIRLAQAEDAPSTPVDPSDTNFKYTTVTTKEGLSFRVPEDMPIEKRGGLLGPIPFDEYTYSKLKQIDTKIQGLNEKLDRIEKKMDEAKEEKKNVLSAH